MALTGHVSSTSARHCGTLPIAHSYNWHGPFRLLSRRLVMLTTIRALVVGLVGLAAGSVVAEEPPSSAPAAVPAPIVAPEPAPTPAPAIIRTIEFSGNTVTRAAVMLQEMTVAIGDPADPARIEESRQAIMDLGLFKSVIAEIVPVDDGVILWIRVTEKYYILPIPKLNRDEDNNISLGAQLRLDNLAGLNQQLRFTYENERSSDDKIDDLIQVWDLEYNYPRIVGTPYQADLFVSRRKTPVGGTDANGAPQLYRNTFDFFSVGLGRWFTKQGPSRGWRGGTSFVWQKQAIDVFEGAPAAFDGRGVGVGAFLEYTNVRNLLYSRNGRVFGWSGEFGSPGLGSDTNYTRNVFYYRAFYPVTTRPHTTINTQAQIGISSDPLFEGATFALGGARTLRGYDSGSITGNAFTLVNIEWLTPIKRDYYPFLGGLFLDIGNTYSSNSQMDLSDPKVGAGVALRFKLKSFVKIELRFDYAYNFDTGEWKAYGGTREAF